MMAERRVLLEPFHARLRYVPELRREDADLIFEFFIVFSRFEYALKKVGFRTNQRGYLQPDWAAFTGATQLKFDLGSAPDIHESILYYLEHPPKIQAMVYDHLAWSPNRKRDSESDYAWVIRSIGIVRNNLFHGGKFPWDAVRDKRLLQYGLIILYHCMSLDNAVFDAFNQPS